MKVYVYIYIYMYINIGEEISHSALLSKFSNATKVQSFVQSSGLLYIYIWYIIYMMHKNIIYKFKDKYIYIV